MVKRSAVALTLFVTALLTALGTGALLGHAAEAQAADAAATPTTSKAGAGDPSLEKAKDAPADRFSPKAMRRRPSLKATGRVGDPSLPEGAVSIPPGHTGEQDEKVAPSAPAALKARGPQPPSPDVAAVNEVKWNQLRDELLNCRIERARALGITPSEIVVTSLRVTWRVNPNGSAANVRVVPAVRTDRKLVTCVRKLTRYSRWIGMSSRAFSMDKDLAFP